MSISKSLSKYLPSKLEITIPTSWIGSQLRGDSRRHYESIKNAIDVFLHTPLNNSKILEIVDLIEATKSVGINRSIEILDPVVTFLRHKILHGDTQTVYYTILLVDVLVKNCAYRIHVLIGRKRFMKTLSLIARRNKERRDAVSQRIANLILGTNKKLPILLHDN